MIYGGCMVPW